MAIPTDVRDAVVRAYYPRSLAVPDGARSRAQAAYGIASAIAAALVAAGVFGDLDERPGSVQVLGVLALVGWLVAAGLYLVAVSRPFVSATATQNSIEAFVYAALDAAQAERAKVDYWQKWAGLASGGAAIVTVLAFAAALVVDTPSDSKAATVTLAGNANAAVAAACASSVATKVAAGIFTVTGSISAGDMEKEFVSVTLDEGTCGAGPTVVAIPRAQVRAVALNR